MAVIDLGTFDLHIGATPTLYNSFDFRDSRAYIINANCTVERPNNIFSYFQFRGIITNDIYTETYSHHVIDKPITTRSFTLFLPFSTLYDSDGSIAIEVERIPFARGGNDDAGTVTLNLNYDDDIETETWF